MKSLVLIILVFIGSGDVTKIARINQVKNEAQTAYVNGNFEEAIKSYTFLIDTLKVDEDPIFLNLANSYYNTKDTSNAYFNYVKLFSSDDNHYRSVAYQQAGIIEFLRKQNEVALEYFKESLKSDPENDEARYNYEVLKKMMSENNQNKKNNNQQGEESKKENEKAEKQESKSKDGKKDESKDEDDGKKEEDERKDQSEGQQGKNSEEPMKKMNEKLKKVKMTEEAARRILEAMKNNEIQYIQQNRRKAEKKPDKNKPDW
jgi:tetratricopeptide (TPR) repeat protein